MRRNNIDAVTSTGRLWPVVLAAMTLSLSVPSVDAAGAPIKQILASHIGWDVNRTKVEEAEKGIGVTQAEKNVCTVASKEECQPAEPSSEPGGFKTPSVAADGSGDVYAADLENARVQELAPDGTFVSMFGWDVNRTKVEEAEKGASVTQAEENVCTASSKDECQAGLAGAVPGQFGLIESLAIDPVSNDVYTAELVFGSEGGVTTVGRRVQEFTADGRFVLEIGKEVNGSTKANLCTEEEAEKGVKCVGPAQKGLGSSAVSEPGAFAYTEGNVLAAGGPEDLLYVGDIGKIQEFETDGKYKREIPLGSISAEAENTSTLTVDKAGNLYIVYGSRNVVHKLASTGEEVKDGHFPLTLVSRNPSVTLQNFGIDNIAIDPSGRVAVSEHEIVNSEAIFFGNLFDSSTAGIISEFTLQKASADLAFNGNDDLYVAIGQEIVAFEPVPVGELVSGPAECPAGTESGTNETFDCKLTGEANPWGVPQTEVAFQWGKTATLGSETPERPIAEDETFITVSEVLKGLRPSETYYYRLAGHDLNAKAPEQFTSQIVSLKTPSVSPRIIGEPDAPFIRSTSAVLFAQLNPENMNTEYDFEYGACQSLAVCPSILKTTILESAIYGKIGVTQEITALQPETTYRYRLSATHKNGPPETFGPEGTFTTGRPIVLQAQTGTVSDVGVTSATISGSVNPDGQPATYAFELGIYHANATQYGVVSSGRVSANVVPTTETLDLSDLQPGTTYAYRIKIESGYGLAYGESKTFTTNGLPAILVVPSGIEMLPAPSIAFPKAHSSLTSRQKLKKALRSCRRKPKRQRVRCQAAARRKYGATKSKRKK